MGNFFEELKRYFEVTPQEKILEDWAKSAECDKVGTTVETFLCTTEQCLQTYPEAPSWTFSTENYEYDLKFTSGFFFN